MTTGSAVPLVSLLPNGGRRSKKTHGTFVCLRNGGKNVPPASYGNSPLLKLPKKQAHLERPWF